MFHWKNYCDFDKMRETKIGFGCSDLLLRLGFTEFYILFDC